MASHGTTETLASTFCVSVYFAAIARAADLDMNLTLRKVPSRLWRISYDSTSRLISTGSLANCSGSIIQSPSGASTK